jgi:transcriptional regulator with XRE-family HTH domain
MDGDDQQHTGSGEQNPRASDVRYGLDRFRDILLYINDPGAIIGENRRRLNLSQRALAHRAGTTQAAVSRIECGLTSPSWDTLRSLFLAMGLELELRPRRLEGRYDLVHLRANRERPPAERLQLAISANRLAGRLREAGREARRVEAKRVAG